jgi:hypothetical protein
MHPPEDSAIQVGSLFQNLSTIDLTDGTFLTAKQAVLGASAVLEVNDTYELGESGGIYFFTYIGTGFYYAEIVSVNGIIKGSNNTLKIYSDDNGSTVWLSQTLDGGLTWSKKSQLF